MIEVKVETIIRLISIKTGNIIQEYSFPKFDMGNENQLKLTLGSIFKQIKEMNLADEEERKINGQ